MAPLAETAARETKPSGWDTSRAIVTGGPLGRPRLASNGRAIRLPSALPRVTNPAATHCGLNPG